MDPMTASTNATSMSGLAENWDSELFWACCWSASFSSSRSLIWVTTLRMDESGWSPANRSLIWLMTSSRASMSGSRTVPVPDALAGSSWTPGGGGWGPLTVTTLMTAGRTTPRRVIGSVSASEFLVSFAASVGFLFGMGDQLREMGVIVLGLLLGGVIAAPFAAWLVSRVNAVVLGTFVGGLLVFLNLLRMSQSMEISPTLIDIAQIATVVLGTRAWRRVKAARESAQADEPPEHEAENEAEHDKRVGTVPVRDGA